MKSVTGKKSAKGSKRKVSHIRIHRAANGFTVHHELAPQNKKRGMLSTGYEPDPPPNVFTDKDAAMQHVGGLMGQMGGDEAEEGNEAA